MTPQTDDVPSLDLARDPDTGVALDIPTGWSQIELPGFQLALAMDEPAHAAVDGSLFRPNINVLVSTVAPGADVALAATETVAALMTMDDGRVLAYDLWAGPDGVMGRHVVSAHRDGAITLGVTHWLFVHNGLATTITATLPITTLPAGEAFGETAVAGLRLPTSGQAPTTSDTTVAAPRPRPDAHLASFGDPYEDISAIGPACTYLGTGPQLDRPLVEMIATS
ncbi:MAG: hypothetical protein QG608_725, partial [Actinomycetota bacterium]|nr:hypothetical protein [Actinomycetota bacterium]